VADAYKKPCLDSSVFIGGLGDEICNGIKRGVIFRYIWDNAKAGVFPIFISAITLAEVYKKKSQPNATPDSTLDEFLEHINEPFVQVIEVDRETGLKAHALCRQYSKNQLQPNDAIHLACALRAHCDFLLAWDTPLVDVFHPDIAIKEPAIYDRGLFMTDIEIATAEEIKIYIAKRDQEDAARTAASRAAVVSKRHELADALADRIVGLHRDGKLPTPFTAKNVRELLAGQVEASRLSEIVPNYCADGDQVKRGRQARFQRLERRKYVCL